MDELRESSLLFSIEGLLETERERVQRETREAERRRQDELERVAEMAERRRVAAEQEREAAARRQALQAERERLEQERIDAMRAATVERARIEAEAKLRLIEVEQTRRHELSLVTAREQESAARYRALSWVTGGASVLAVLGAAVAYLGFIAPAHARVERELRAQIASAQARVSSAERALAAEREKTRELTARPEAASGAPLATAPPVEQAKPKPPALRPMPGAHAPRRPSTCVDDGDPLSSCLGAKR